MVHGSWLVSHDSVGPLRSRRGSIQPLRSWHGSARCLSTQRVGRFGPCAHGVARLRPIAHGQAQLGPCARGLDCLCCCLRRTTRCNTPNAWALDAAVAPFTTPAQTRQRSGINDVDNWTQGDVIGLMAPENPTIVSEARHMVAGHSKPKHLQSDDQQRRLRV